MEYAFDGVRPTIDPAAFVCREATLVGDVSLGPEASVWPGAVLRGDVDPVDVGRCSHVEDNAVLHHATVGEEVMVGHGAVLNGTTIGDRVLVGMNSTVNMGVEIQNRCVIAPNAVVPQDREIPTGSLVRGVPAEVVPADQVGVDVDEVLATYSPAFYADMASRHGLFERTDDRPDGGGGRESGEPEEDRGAPGGSGS